MKTFACIVAIVVSAFAGTLAVADSPQLVPRLIVVEKNGGCPDWEAPDSRCLVVGGLREDEYFIPFGPQNIDAIAEAISQNLNLDDPELLAELAGFVTEALQFKTYFPHDARHITTTGAAEGIVLLNIPFRSEGAAYEHSVVLTGTDGDVIDLGSFVIDQILPVTPEDAECDDDPFNSYCHTWRVRSPNAADGSPVFSEVCLAIGFFRQ